MRTTRRSRRTDELMAVAGVLFWRYLMLLGLVTGLSVLGLCAFLLVR